MVIGLFCPLILKNKTMSSVATQLSDFFSMIIQKKGSDAAMAMGTESAVYAEEASDNNDLIDRILPASVSDYVELVKAHIAAGE